VRKTLIVAQSEFATLVRSKAFIISVVLMPLIMSLSVFLIRSTKDTTDYKDRTFAFVDYSGVVAEPLRAVANLYNSSGPDAAESTARGSKEAPAGLPGAPALNLGKPSLVRKGARFIPVEVKPDGRTPEQLRVELCERVRREELFAFVELPKALLDPASGATIRYYSDHPSYSALPEWLRAAVNGIVLNERFRQASVDRALLLRLTKQASLEELGLVERAPTGELRGAQQVDRARAYGVPLGGLLLMYIMVMSSAPQLLNSVIEEKMSRISEVLVASVTPFELMMGKLIGGVGISTLLAAIYIGGGLVVAQWWGGYASAVTPAMLLWFALFLVMSIFLFGSLFVAIGAACNDLKDSQNMMTPVMVLVMIPIFTSPAVLRAPDATVATVLSLIPTAAPFLMMLRISLAPGPPAWQIAASLVVMMATVVVVVWAAGKIFRTGLLMQGKSATLGEMLRWIRQK
jgi:ABC-2 type transport system permease protein